MARERGGAHAASHPTRAVWGTERRARAPLPGGGGARLGGARAAGGRVRRVRLHWEEAACCFRIGRFRAPRVRFRAPAVHRVR